MQLFADLPSLSAAIMGFAVDHAGKLPTAAAARFVAAASRASPVDSVVFTAEALYANRSAIADAPALAAAQVLTGQCAAFAATYGWHDMAVRGPQILTVMRRDLGEPPPAGLTWPDPSTDPLPKPGWAAVVAG